ncbi:MAG: transglutaminase domain-containing protein [Phycisphaerales bacterium]
MTTAQWTGRLAAGIALALLSAPAPAQYGGQRGRDSEEPRIVARVKPHEWTLTTRVNVRLDQFARDANGMPLTTGFKFDTVSVIFPLIPETASSISAPIEPVEGVERYRPYIKGRLMLNDATVNERPEVLSNYAAGARLGKWTHRDWSGKEMTLEVTLPVTAYQTTFDEKLAMAAGWPDAWPEPAASCMQPQYWIDLDPAKGPYDMTPIKEFVRRATNGKDPKSVPPAMLAKVLAGEVLRAVNPSAGDGLNFNRTGELEGIDLKGAPQTLLDGRGSEFDMACVLVAAYRAAGLPARTVIGYDVGEGKTGNRFLGKSGSAELRAWVEFPLLDKDSKIVWVPVDVVRMRKSGSRPKPIAQRWPFFGEHDELDRVIPFAFQFHPPTTVVAYGSPAFWGWLVTPKPPDRVMQTVRFGAITTPTTAEEQKRRREEERQRQGGGRK